METPNKKVCIVATTGFAINWFMAPHIRELVCNYDVTIIANGKHSDLTRLDGANVRFICLDIRREVALIQDIRALFSLWKLFFKYQFDCVHSIMPKSGLLAMCAAKLAGVPLRCHTFTGQVWATRKGILRYFLMFLDKIVAKSATMLLTDSPTQQRFLVDNNIAHPSKIKVLADGSVSGVDVQRFMPDSLKRKQMRTTYDIPTTAMVFLYLGRLKKDKGICDLSNAFAKVAAQNAKVHLMIVGPDEERLDYILLDLAERFPGRVHRIGFTHCPETFMAAADVFCLPSYREGFGSTIIEAASVGLPSVATRIYGITDAVDDGITGILHEPGNIDQLSAAMLQFANNPQLCYQMGAISRERAIMKFSQERVTKAFVEFYRQLFQQIR